MSLPLKQLEELSLKHWPALNTEYMDGWKLRMANGYTKRANCISTLSAELFHAAPSTSKQLLANIASCEHTYSVLKQPTIFKVTPFSEPQLDETLEKLDYKLLDPSLMLTLALKDLPAQAPSLKLSDNSELMIRFEEHISLRWLEQYCQHSGISEQLIPTMIDMIAAMPGQVLLASCLLNNEPVALAMAVVDGDVVGLYDVLTVASHRNLGLCGYLLWKLLQHCQQQNATSSYLAVLESNSPARHVYAKLGFGYAYRYWYRVNA